MENEVIDDHSLSSANHIRNSQLVWMVVSRSLRVLTVFELGVCGWVEGFGGLASISVIMTLAGDGGPEGSRAL